MGINLLRSVLIVWKQPCNVNTHFKLQKMFSSFFTCKIKVSSLDLIEFSIFD